MNTYGMNIGELVNLCNQYNAEYKVNEHGIFICADETTLGTIKIAARMLGYTPVTSDYIASNGKPVTRYTAK